MHGATDPYAVLGLTPSADQVVVHAAWKALLRKYHPDINADNESAARTREINEAFAILGKPETRAAYDRARGGVPAVPPRQSMVPVAPRRTAPPVAPHFRSAPRRHMTTARMIGAALLIVAAVPVTGTALLAYPATSAATQHALLSYSAGSPLATSLVARLDALAAAITADPATPPAPRSDRQPAQVATTDT